MTPKISVVMASYNHAAFVRQAVESALNQSFTDLEVVITDDGSRDGTADVIRGLTDPRIRLEVLPENRGACLAVNGALARARGDYVAVLNSDDFFLPGKLERQAAFLEAHPEIGAVFGQPHFVDERGRPFANPSHAFPKIY
jgi:glycosyltransferase involved in cell wall biosynthesis